MGDLANKLQLRGAAVHVIGAPREFAPDFAFAAEGDEDAAVLVFVRDAAELERHADVAVSAAQADRLAWIAYPKGGQLGTDLNRDVLARAMQARGVRGVRQVSVDDVWSALRFRAGG